MTQKFRKKPVVIEAVIWNGENLKEVIDFTGKSTKWDEYFKSIEEYELFVKNDRNVFKIFTIEGTMEASVGDYIIRGVNGEHYPCKPDIFEKTYEPVYYEKLAKEEKTFTYSELEELQNKVYQIVGNGDVMKLFNSMLGVSAGSGV